jgi:uncharacterized metal-binding protein
MNIKNVIAQQAKVIYQYRNTKEKLYKTNAAIWYSTTKYAERTAYTQIHNHCFWLVIKKKAISSFTGLTVWFL